jgi:hypothetical protein
MLVYVGLKYVAMAIRRGTAAVEYVAILIINYVAHSVVIAVYFRFICPIQV